MNSWRESSPDHVQDVFDCLFGLAIEAALDLLARHKEFYPFAFEAIGDDAAMVAAVPALGEHPESQAVLDALYKVGRDRNDKVDAFAFVSDVRLEDGSDAIQVELEHRERHALSIAMPYRHRKLRRGIATGQMSVSAGTLRAWA